MPTRHVISVSTALLCVFVAIAVSVVRAREPLDEAVSRSFDAVAAAELPERGSSVVPLGCRKLSVDIYDCSSRLRPRRARAIETQHFRLTLRDDGCWSTAGFTRILAKSPSRALDGCIED